MLLQTVTVCSVPHEVVCTISARCQKSYVHPLDSINSLDLNGSDVTSSLPTAKGTIVERIPSPVTGGAAAIY